MLEAIRATAASLGERVRRVFLADGDALVLPTRRLLTILSAIREHMPWVHRVSSYCLARNLARKSRTKLRSLRQAGLAMVYLGAESGDDLVLERVGKGETFASTRSALDKLGEAQISRSVMILNGGRKGVFEQHAEHSAQLMNLTQPEYLSTLVVSFPAGEARFRAGFAQWEALDQTALFAEMERFVSALALRRTVFVRTTPRTGWCSGHAEYGQTAPAGRDPGRNGEPAGAPLRPAWARGL